jgi:FlaA1/EpsC-like NDP-sugar epimerase
MTGVYFVKSLAFSRIAFAVAALAIFTLLPLWRTLVSRVQGLAFHGIFIPARVLVVGSGHVAASLIRNLETERAVAISGIVWPALEPHPPVWSGYPVLGTVDALARIFKETQAGEVLIASSSPWYSYVIEMLASVKSKAITIRWVPDAIMQLSEQELPEKIPLHDFSV